MKGLICIIIFFWISNTIIHAEDMLTDTIDCMNIINWDTVETNERENVQVIIKVPNLEPLSNGEIVLFDPKKTYYYEEGFYKFYIINMDDNSAVVFHYGTMAMNSTFEGQDMNLYNLKLGNIARSRAYTKDGLYFRQDSYFKYHINISYERVRPEKKQLVDSILDNVVIRRISPK